MENTGERKSSSKRGWGAALVAAFLGAIPTHSSEVPPASLPLREFVDEVERDFSLRSVGNLQVSNLRGSVQVQGWALDKIRVKARRRVRAESEEVARRLFDTIDFRYRSIEKDMELAAEYGRGLEIQQRLRERESPQTGMDMIVMAPSNLSLRVWTSAGNASVKSWSGPVEVRTSSGPITLDAVKADTVLALCPECSIEAREIRGSLRCVAGSGKVLVSDVSGKQVYVETTSGEQRLARVSGQQLYVSKGGRVHGRELRGRMEFHTQNGEVELQDSRGFVSGRTETGNVSLRMREWKFEDRALIESVKGEILLQLPPQFAGEVDVWSVLGKTQLAFPFEAFQEEHFVGPQPANRLRGRVGRGGEQLRVFSEEGNVQIIKGI